VAPCQGWLNGFGTAAAVRARSSTGRSPRTTPGPAGPISGEPRTRWAGSQRSASTTAFAAPSPGFAPFNGSSPQGRQGGVGVLRQHVNPVYHLDSTMPLNNVQIGVIAQNEWAKLVVIGSDGKLEVSWPMTDDERRDAEVHIGRRFGEFMSVQVKTATYLQRPQSRVTPMLEIPFTVPESRLMTDPRFWYHLSLLSLPARGFVDPQYLVNSTKRHRHAVPRLRNGVWHLSFQANMAERSRDK